MSAHQLFICPEAVSIIINSIDSETCHLLFKNNIRYLMMLPPTLQKTISQLFSTRLTKISPIFKEPFVFAFCIANKFFNANSVSKYAVHFLPIEKLQKIDDVNYRPDEIFIAAATKGKLSILQWLLDHNEAIIHYEDYYRYISGAVAKGHLDIVRWFFDNFPAGGIPVLSKKYYLGLAAGNGHLPLLQFLCECFSIDRDIIRSGNNHIFSEAMQKGHLDILQWLLENYRLPRIVENDRAFLDALQHGYFKVVRWAAENFQFKQKHKIAALWKCVHTGDLPALQCLIDAFSMNQKNITIANQNYIFRHAAKKGHLHILKWLNDHFHLDIENVRSLDNYALRYAARKGHLDVLVWLFDNFELDESDVAARDDYAFSVAKKYGQQHIIDWLIENFDY